ncbi:MAG: hypothetical protein JWR26_4408 [Pedosphaera sp.]|nr:hypothetical protein [Pedosphaera sp.]
MNPFAKIDQVRAQIRWPGRIHQFKPIIHGDSFHLHARSSCAHSGFRIKNLGVFKSRIGLHGLGQERERLSHATPGEHGPKQIRPCRKQAGEMFIPKMELSPHLAPADLQPGREFDICFNRMNRDAKQTMWFIAKLKYFLLPPQQGVQTINCMVKNSMRPPGWTATRSLNGILPRVLGSLQLR